jgi:hypothetical protein
MVGRVRHGRSGKLRTRHAPNPLPAGIDFEIIDRNHSNAALGTEKIGSGRAGTEILSCLSPEALADYQ